MANFSPTCPIDQSGPPPEVHCPEYSWWIEPKQTFPYCHKSLEVLEVSCPLTHFKFVYALSLLRFWYLTLDQSCMYGMVSSHYQAKESLPLHWRSNSMENLLNPMEKILTQFSPMANLTAAMTKSTTKFHLEDHHGHCLQDSMKRQRRYCSVRNSLIGQIQPRLSEWKDILVPLSWHLRYVL